MWRRREGMLIFWVISALLMTGCEAAKKVTLSEESILDLAVKTMEERYDKRFVISSISVEDRGQNFTDPYYLMHASADGGNEFLITADTDGSNIRDDYGKVLYELDLRTDIEHILDDCEIKYKNMRLDYLLSDRSYDSAEEYAAAGNVRVYADIYASADPRESKDAQQIFELITRMRNRGYGFQLRLHRGNGVYLLRQWGNDPEVSLDSIKVMLGENDEQ